MLGCMADLQLAPARDRSVAPALLIAIFVLAAVAGAVFWFNPHNVADLSVVHAVTFAPHTEVHALDSGRHGGMRVLGGATSVGEDDLYVVATVSVTDRLRIPIFLTDITAHVTFADGSEADAPMIPGNEIPRLEGIFPAITPLINNPIAALDDEVDPGQTRTGSVVLPLPGKSAQDWKTKRSATLSVQLRNQNELTTPLP